MGTQRTPAAQTAATLRGQRLGNRASVAEASPNSLCVVLGLDLFDTLNDFVRVLNIFPTLDPKARCDELKVLALTITELLRARRAVMVINDIAAYYWQGLARFLATLRPQPIAARAP